MVIAVAGATALGVEESVVVAVWVVAIAVAIAGWAGGDSAEMVVK